MIFSRPGNAARVFPGGRQAVAAIEKDEWRTKMKKKKIILISDNESLYRKLRFALMLVGMDCDMQGNSPGGAIGTASMPFLWILMSGCPRWRGTR